MRQREERDRKRKGREKKKEEKYEKHRDTWGGATAWPGMVYSWLSTPQTSPSPASPSLRPLLQALCLLWARAHTSLPDTTWVPVTHLGTSCSLLHQRGHVCCGMIPGAWSRDPELACS